MQMQYQMHPILEFLRSFFRATESLKQPWLLVSSRRSEAYQCVLEAEEMEKALHHRFTALGDPWHSLRSGVLHTRALGCAI